MNITEPYKDVKLEVNATLFAKQVLVAQVLPDLYNEGLLSEELAARSFDGSRKLVCEITRETSVKSAVEAFYKAGTPTASYMAKEHKAFASEWWAYINDQPAIDLDRLKKYRKAVDYEVKSTFDAVFHKLQTGKELPAAKDGYTGNVMQALRRATQNGDAAIILYRIKFWMPKATVIMDGRKWIAKTHKQWAEELGMEDRGFRTAYDRLVKLQLIEARIAKFNGVTINHLRPTVAAEKLFSGETD